MYRFALYSCCWVTNGNTVFVTIVSSAWLHSNHWFLRCCFQFGLERLESIRACLRFVKCFQCFRFLNQYVSLCQPHLQRSYGKTSALPYRFALRRGHESQWRIVFKTINFKHWTMPLWPSAYEKGTLQQCCNELDQEWIFWGASLVITDFKSSEQKWSLFRIMLWLSACAKCWQHCICNFGTTSTTPFCQKFFNALTFMHRCTEVHIFGDAKNFYPNLILFFPK